jgi:hypothetical protein
MSDARGLIHIHSCPVALAQHVSWTLSSALNSVIRPVWSDQPIESGTLWADVEWSGAAGMAAALTSALRGWNGIRFDITEATSAGRDGVRYSHTPTLGIFYTLVDSHGNAVVGEDRIRYAMGVAAGDAQEMERELRLALGSAWDDELEPYRAGRYADVVPLTRPSHAV